MGLGFFGIFCFFGGGIFGIRLRVSFLRDAIFWDFWDYFGIFWDILGFFEMLEISSGSLEVRGIVEGFSTDSWDFQSISKDILGFLIDS